MKKALLVLSEYGYWGEELLGPLTHLDKAGYDSVFITPKGKRSHALPPSADSAYIDPPLNCTVTSADTAAKVKALDASPRLDNPRNLSAVFPERPYFSAPDFLRRLEQYYADRKSAGDAAVTEFEVLVLIGGSGPIVDMVNNQRVHDLILSFHQAGKPIGAICNAVTCLAFARELQDRKSLLAGKHVTGHCIESDYHDGTGFLNTDFNIGPPPFVLEYVLRDAVGPTGQYHGNFGKRTSVIVDYPFVSARSSQCSFEFGAKLAEVLDHGLKRYGW
jgi:putative intracellular protease/amidase